MQPLVEWNELEIFVRGARLDALARAALARRRTPVEKLRLDFRDGLIRIEGVARKIIAIPFRIDIERVDVVGNSVVVPIGDVSAFGVVPIPEILLRLIEPVIPQDGVRWERSRASIVVTVDRFLPPYAEVTVRQVRLERDGLRIMLGPGSADLPPGMEEKING